MAVFLAGGSAFGLDCAAVIMQFLEQKKIGFDVARDPGTHRLWRRSL